MKRFLFWMVCVLLLLAGAASAERVDQMQWRESGDFSYVLLDDGTAEIVDYRDAGLYDLELPSEIDGYPVTSIGRGALSNGGFRTITIPNSVTRITGNPFPGTRLQKVIVDQDHPVFAHISGVLFDKQQKKLICYPTHKEAQAYEIPNGIRIIGEGAFRGICYLSRIVIPDSVTTIENYAFGSCYVTHLDIPDSVVEIKGNPFYGLSYLDSIGVSKEHPVFAIRSSMLYDKQRDAIICCPRNVGISSWDIPKELRIIGDYAFSGCRIRGKLEMPDGLIEIGKSAFYECKKMTSIELPSSVTKIGNNAFLSCEALQEVLIPENVEYIGDYAFAYCNQLGTIAFPENASYIGKNVLQGCENLASIQVLSGNQNYESIEGVLFDTQQKTLIAYPANKEGASYMVPEGTKTIASGAFYQNKRLREVTLPDGLTEIGDRAFSSSNISNITFSDGAIHIGESAFSFCNNLKGIDLPQRLALIGKEMFRFCDGLSEIVIPDGVTSIGEDAFCYCEKLSMATIPASVIEIGKDAFRECSPDLMFIVDEDSFAMHYAQTLGIPYQFHNAYDWLYN